MKSRITFILVYACCWLLIFQIARLFFLLYHFEQSRALPFGVAAGTFGYGLRMDASMMAYLTLPVCLFVLLGVWISFFSRKRIYSIYTAVVLFFIVLLTGADAEMYRQWGFRIDATPLRYLSSPAEAWASISHLPLPGILFIFILTYWALAALFIGLMGRLMLGWQQPINKAATALAVLTLAAVGLIPLRGGLQQTPMNQSSVYFSSVNFANQAALNASWNFMQGVLAYKDIAQNPYVHFSAERAGNIKDSLYIHSKTTVQVLNTKTPNVILIVWESLTEKALHAAINGQEILPQFQQLQKEGLYFNQLYASGDRTDKGLAAILSGYPALPATSVLRDVGKAARLPSLGRTFKQQGYSVPFFYGGEPEFANIKSYLLQAGFYPLTEKKNFAAKDQNSKWGAHDGVVAQTIKQDLLQIRPPFFAAWLTLTSHEPFETPIAPVFKGNDETTRFLNSLHYTDAVVGDFVSFCKRQNWWYNTLLIIVGDHGHPLPQTPSRADNFRTPMLWLGGALIKKGVVSQVISQVDLPATLLAQTSVAVDAFPFSKNHFDPSVRNWAFFSFKDGWGFIQPGEALLFDNVGQRTLERKGPVTGSDLEAGKALQQYIYEDYIRK